MAETGVLLDRRGEPVGPAIAWHDVRGTDEARAIAGELGRGRSPRGPACRPRRCARSPSSAGSARTRRAPRTRCAGSACPSGSRARSAPPTSPSCRWRRAPGMLSLRDRAWWPEALAWLGVPEGFLAELVPAGTPLGRVGDALPAARGAVITVAGHDHVAAMVGAGATAEGDVLHSSGTADVFVRSVPQPLEDERIADAVANGVTVGWHVIPERWALLSGNELNVSLAVGAQALGVERPGRAGGAAAAAGRGRSRPGEARGTPDDPRPRLAGRAGGGRRPQRRDPRPHRRGGRAADADRRDGRRRARRRPRAPSRRRSWVRSSGRPSRRRRPAAPPLLAGVAAGLVARSRRSGGMP